MPEPGLAPPQAPGEAPQAAQRRREEHVLSALLQGHPEAGRILDFLPVAAFTSQLRQEFFQAVRYLQRTGRPVDALTVDWERSQLFSRPVGDGSYTTRLAGAPVGDSPLGAARRLYAQLQRRTPARPFLPAPLPAESRPAIAAPGQQQRGPQLTQQPPGGIPRQPGPGPRR
ncbi:MAG: DnaB-like helicase N-terminal domain-containing protein [Trebonia sp.]